MSSVLLVAVLCLATHRLTRLATRDAVPLVKVPRDALVNWLDPRDTDGSEVGQAPLGALGRAAAYLLECDWCASVYVGGVLVWATAFTVGAPWPWLVWPVCSTVAGLIADFEHRSEQRQQLAAAETARVQATLGR